MTAKFPSTKSLDSFDCKIMPSSTKPLTTDLARCDDVDRRENLIALGASSLGKTHITLGLGLVACQKWLKVRFTTAAALVHDLVETQEELRLQRLTGALLDRLTHHVHIPERNGVSYRFKHSRNKQQ